ncbi:YppG family protein [Paraliobacillus sediminis]|uniref:YppG family protein n=1 Tax=Paraliobacillus sediminis TaxID=1885916 RepID=UPI000E3E28C3|nr:YppG family protein [Paraliobacillus sediminis]
MLQLGPPPQRRPYRNQRQGRRVLPPNAFPFQGNSPFGQANSPFQRNFMTPQRPQFYGQQRPSQGLGSLIRDENGKIDMGKIDKGFRNVMGVASQAGPVIKMVRGLF